MYIIKRRNRFLLRQILTIFAYLRLWLGRFFFRDSYRRIAAGSPLCYSV